MPPRRRSELGRKLPDNVYFATARGRIYFRWKHPITGQITSLGPDLEHAQAEGARLNSQLADTYGSAVRSAMKIRGRDRNVGVVLDQAWDEYFTKKGWSETHQKEVRILVELYRDRWGRFSLRDVTTRVLSAQLDTLAPHAQLKHRQFWIHVFRYAVARGLIEDNPAERTLRPSEQDLKRRTARLTLEQFKAIRKAAEPELQIAMDVALYSLQRRGDLVQLTKAAVSTSAEPWTLEVSPSKAEKRDVHIRIAVPRGSGLRSALQAALAFEVPCPFLLARKPSRQRHGASKAHWAQWTPNLLSKRFAAAREASRACEELDAAERPGFHQIRALGAHLYEEAGYPRGYVQILLGHSSARMTEHYQEGHVVRWAEAEAGL